MTSTSSEPTPAQLALAESAQATHQAIARLAAARSVRDAVRADRSYTGSMMMDAASAFREAEANVQASINAEVDAHIAVMDEGIAQRLAAAPSLEENTDTNASS